MTKPLDYKEINNNYYLFLFALCCGETNETFQN